MEEKGIKVGASVTKKPWESKTVVVNAILSILGGIGVLMPGALSISNWMNSNGAMIAVGWGILNVILRLLTKNEISLTE